MIAGYMGRILFVDLSSGEIREETPDEKFYQDFIGGYGLGSRILYSRQQGGVDPLGPENTIGFTTGPLTGVRGLFSSRFTVVSKSPLTGGWGDANCGGYFGPYVKFSGYDAVFFNGISPTPVYLFIKDGKAALRDAGQLWGKDSRQTEEMLKSDLGKDIAVACIGPAGEKLSLISCVMHDIGCAAGRSGLGAVMGSKKLKAVVVTGTSEVPVPDRDQITQVSQEFVAHLSGDYYERFKKWGTCGDNANAAANGDSPVKNWAGVGVVDFPDAQAIGGDAVIALQERKHGCLWCPVRCKGIMKAGTSYQYEAGGHKPEYETSGAFGMLLLNNHLESLIKANDICNRYGLDTISAGAAIAFAIECYENGIITKSDTDGIELAWGKNETIVSMTESLAKREGFGDVLADGVKRASERIGGGADKYAIHAGGQELPMHDPKFMPLFAPSYECDATPGRHTSGAADPTYAKMNQVMNASGMCLLQWTAAQFGFLDKLVAAATGWDFGMPQILEAGERISNMRQAFTVREGLKPDDFKVSVGRVMGNPPLTEGPTANVTVDAEDLRSAFFKGMDWDLETGRPNKERLEALGLTDVAADLWP
ncbi:MAG: aldehyde ferredoxin oxidoreductase family protein [Chloroflexi bacterium]|nr:aldehyde ferredoxin oxidoreductase family protein [Chloroflexota bacterium]